MSTINVKSGYQFRPDLSGNTDRWLEAAGKELEAKQRTVKIGTGATAKVVRNAAELRAAYKELQNAARTAGVTEKAYMSDLLQAIDDVVRADATYSAPGDVFDLTQGSNMSKALGLGDNTRQNYGSMSTTDFGRAARRQPVGTMQVDGVTLQREGPPSVPTTPGGTTPTTPGGTVTPTTPTTPTVPVTPPAPPTPSGPLADIPHMSAESLRNAPVTYGRDGEEVEATNVISGMSKTETVALAQAALGDLQRPKAAAGLTLGMQPLDEMSWESEAHAMRRANPYVSFTLDSRSFEVNPNNGQPRVAIGRDFFFDTFMAKKDLNTGKLTKALQQADLMYRTRIRYGSDQDPFQGTRVLIGMKEGTSVDSDGTKHARKIDSRSDSPTQAMFDTLVKSAQTAKLDASWSWNGSNQAPPAAVAMYRTAVQRGITDDIGGETGVLALEPAAVARQIRGRFHLNETGSDAVLNGFKTAGEPKIAELAQLITAATDWPAAQNLPSKTDLLAQANALTDRSAIVAAAREGVLKANPGVTVDKALIDRLWPGQPVTQPLDIKMQRAVADAIRSTYDAFAENVDQLQRNIGGNTDRAVRDAGSANDVRDFMRQKSAVARFVASNPVVTVPQGTTAPAAQTPAYYVMAAKQIIDMPDGREKTDKLQRIGIGLSQLRAMTEASFASPVKVSGELFKKQTFDASIIEFDAQMAGANKDAFAAELAEHLAAEDNQTLKNATDKSVVLGNIRKNLVTAHAEVLHRMIEGSATWAQSAWFNNYRSNAIGVTPSQWGNFIIGSMDYTELYDNATGQALSFQDRVKRTPLDVNKMAGAMISNDFQIELASEEGYTRAIRTAQYGVNAAAAGLMMDYALSKNVPGLTAGNAVGFEKWFAEKESQSPSQREAFLNELDAYARSKNSPIDVRKAFVPLLEQEKAIRVLTAFAKQKDPTLNVDDRQVVEQWYRTQGNLSEQQLNDFLTEVARFAAAERSEVPLSPNLLRSLDFKPFAGSNVGQPVTNHATLMDQLNSAEEIWSMMKQSQRDFAAIRGQEVQRVLRDNNLRDKKWEPPTKAKGDYAIDAVLR